MVGNLFFFVLFLTSFGHLSFLTSLLVLVHSQTALSAMAGNLLFSLFLTSYGHFQLSHVLSFCLVHSQFCSEDGVARRTCVSHFFFSAAVICSVSSSFTNFPFPSHTSASSSLGNCHIHQDIYLNPRVKVMVILVSRCESVRIASVLPTRVLPFPITFAMCASQEQSFEISTPGYVYWSPIGKSFSPRSQLKFTPRLPYVRYIQLL